MRATFVDVPSWSKPSDLRRLLGVIAPSVVVTTRALAANVPRDVLLANNDNTDDEFNGTPEDTDEAAAVAAAERRILTLDDLPPLSAEQVADTAMRIPFDEVCGVCLVLHTPLGSAPCA